MEQTVNYLEMLSDSLDKKIAILSELSRLTALQKELASADSFDADEFSGIVERKGSLIDELERLDNGFSLLYNNVKEQLDNNKAAYAEQIKLIQGKISLILDDNAALTVAEESNKKLIESRFASLKKEIHQVRKSRSTAANYYKTMNNITDEAYFLDSKK